MNFSLLQFFIIATVAQEMPKKYQRMCNTANCETCQNYLMNFVIKENDNNNKIFKFCTGILQAQIPTRQGAIPCCNRVTADFQFGLGTGPCGRGFNANERANLTGIISEICSSEDCLSGLDKSDQGEANLQQIRNAGETCKKKEADKLIKILYFFGLFMVAFACAALFLAYSRHRAPDFHSYQSELAVRESHEKMISNRNTQIISEKKHDEPRSWSARLSNSSKSLKDQTSYNSIQP